MARVYVVHICIHEDKYALGWVEYKTVHKVAKNAMSKINK